MRPIPIPDAWVPEGAERRVLAAPGGDLTDPDVAPLEVLVGTDTYTSFWVTEPSDRHIPFLVVGLTCHGVQPPVSMRVFRREQDED